MLVKFDKLIKTQTGKYIISILLGLGLATAFRKVCKGKNCLVRKAPPIEEIDGQTYKFDGKCYSMERHPVKCNKSKNIYKFEK